MHEALSNKYMRIPHHNKKIRIPIKKSSATPSPPHYAIFGWTKGGTFKIVLGFRNFRYDFQGVSEMFEGDSADMCAGKFPLC